MARRPTTGWPDVPSIGHQRRFTGNNGKARMPPSRLHRPKLGTLNSADHVAKDAHIIATRDLSGIFGSEAAAQHRRDEAPPLRVVGHATRRTCWSVPMLT